MDTKSKRFRRSTGMKSLAFTLACLSFCASIWVMLLMFYSSTYLFSFESAVESIFEDTYANSTVFAREVTATLYQLHRANDWDSISPADDLILDERVVYYAFYTDADKQLMTRSNTDMRTADQFSGYSPFIYFYADGIPFQYYAPTSFIYTFGDDAHNSVTVYLAFTHEYMQDMQQQWIELHNSSLIKGIAIVGCLLACIISVAYLSFVTGRRAGSDELFLSPLDSIYSDIILCLIAAFTVAWAGMGVMLNEYAFYSSGRANIVSAGFTILITAICTPCILALWLALMRKIKARRLMRHTLVFTVINGIFRIIGKGFRLIGRFFANIFSGRRFRGYPFAHAMHIRQRNFIGLSFIMVVAFLLFIFVGSGAVLLAFGCVLIELVLVFFYVKANNDTFEDMEKVCTQIGEIFHGNMEYDPGVKPGSQLSDASSQLLDVGGGMEKAMQRQMASERMKIELITNVSHDLKTPLTSIIGYIDLLSRDDALSPEARDYVAILTQKSLRLKTIIEDLFVLAKTTSGDDSSLNMEVLNLRRLIEQALADMDDKITRSGQTVRTTLTEMPVFIKADGSRLYRVIQNIMDNALKYSMPGTRIYITLGSSPTQARLAFKNTASYEMDFTPSEILERFARGDRSRSTDGSGLGLSIAEGFTRALGGQLDISIDGDQFKAELTFAIAAPPSEGEAEAPQAEAVPTGLTDRMAFLKGKLYKPDDGTAPVRILPPEADDGHFEPERPVELTELESVLEAFSREDGRWSSISDSSDDDVTGGDEKTQEAPPQPHTESPDNDTQE